MTKKDHPIVLVDASGWLFRAYHALPPLTDARGEATGAAYGMINMLRRLQREIEPKRIAVIFDAPGPTFREEIYSDYKANRDATPEDLLAHFPKIVELVLALGLPLIAVEGVEADDVIGTLAKAAASDGSDVLIVTSDKDLAQLVGPHVSLLDTMKNRRMDVAGVVDKFGVPPERMADYLALIGDASDNIPGIPLVGPKTAATWIKKYGSLDGIVLHAEEIGGRVGENLRAHLQQLPMALKLATIRCDVVLPVHVDDLEAGVPDTGRLAILYRKFGFSRLLAELSVAGAESAAVTEGDGRSTCETKAGATDAVAVVTHAGLDAMLTALREAELVSVDTETDSLDAMQARLVGISFAVRPGHGWYIPLAHDYLGAPEQLPMGEVLAQLKPLLEDAARPKLGQHIKYDMNVLARYDIEMAGVAYDTMLESYVLDAGGNRHDMDTLAERYLGYKTIRFDEVTGRGKGQLTFNQVALEQAVPYAAEDADVTLRLHYALYPKVCDIASLRRVFQEIEMPLVPVLARMEREGVKIDGALLAEISAELANRMAQLQNQAWHEAGSEFNLGSPKQLQTILFERLQLPVLTKTPKGDASTAESVLEELAGSHSLPRIILDWRAMAKLRSTYAENLPKQINSRTGRIHTSYHQAVAATGRLSSSDPNLQNIPVRSAEGRRIRQAFIAEPGNALLSVDYSQIELRLMAHLSGDKRLQEAFHQGVDVHLATAAEVFGLGVDDVGSGQRRAAKAINFGLIYGMSAFGLARQLGISRGDAQEYIDRFFMRYPGVRCFMESTREKARSQGYVETLYGRRLYLPEINSRNAGQRQYAERTAINAPLQGTAADLIKCAMIDLAGWMPANAPDVRMIMQVHDELVFEGPAASLRENASRIARQMCHVRVLDVPLGADWGIGANWDAAHRSRVSVRSDD